MTGRAGFVCGTVLCQGVRNSAQVQNVRSGTTKRLAFG